MSFHSSTKGKHYSFVELLSRVNEIKREYPQTTGGIKCGKVELLLHLQPTETSIEYTVKLIAKQGSKCVSVFIISPHIGLYYNTRRTPHMYSDGSLCLYYPQYNEWSYNDSWARTIVPWTCLWLFYYEIWRETNQWLGGGIHGKKNILPA